jgi:hypothetical protein
MMRDYFRKADGTPVYYSHSARAIAAAHPELIGAHIFPQLRALGLFEDFAEGTTPCQLPYSFTDELEAA